MMRWTKSSRTQLMSGALPAANAAMYWGPSWAKGITWNLTVSLGFFSRKFALICFIAAPRESLPPIASTNVRIFSVPERFAAGVSAAAGTTVVPAAVVVAAAAGAVVGATAMV